MAQADSIQRSPPFTSFVGRRPLISELKQRLAATRVVTLTGPGGIGKTRLASRVVDDELASHPDGLWWAELSTVGDPAIVLPTVAEAVGLRAAAAVPLTEMIVDHVADRRALLVLDGC